MDDLLIQELNKLTLDKVKKFTFKGLFTLAKVLKVYDADTITVGLKYNDEFIKLNVRISGVDSPELRSKNEDEKNSAKIAQKYLSTLILDTIIRIKFLDFDKYGRPLAHVYLMDGTSISDMLICGGFCKEYHGGTKTDWKDDELISITKL